MPKVVATVMPCQPPLAGVGRYECPVDINCAMRESVCLEVSVDGVSRSGRRVVVPLQDALRLPLTLCLRGAACRERATDGGVDPVSSPRDSQLPHAQERRARRPTPAGQPSSSGRTGVYIRAKQYAEETALLERTDRRLIQDRSVSALSPGTRSPTSIQVTHSTPSGPVTLTVRPPQSEWLERQPVPSSGSCSSPLR